MSRFDLLPPNSTQLERDLSRVTSSLERTGRPVPIIRTAKRMDIPDSVVPWLIFEYGLGEILQYLGNNQRRALEEGVLWQRIRGTPESVRIALGWIGIDGYIEESARGMQRWAEYQLGLTAATADDVIDSIAGVARISSPVRSRLQRIYAVYDRRRFVLNKSLLSGGDMLSDHSGVRLRPDWPQISYGNIVVVYVRRSTDGVDISGAHMQSAGALIRQRNRFILNETKIGELWHKPNYPFVMSEQIGISGKYEGQVAGYFLPLSMIPADVNVIVHVGLVTEEGGSYVSANLVGAVSVGPTEIAPNYLDVWPTVGPLVYASVAEEIMLPQTPTLTLAADTGASATDGVTSNQTVNVGNLQPVFTWEYSLNGGTTWTIGSGTSFVLPAGSYASGSIAARQRDNSGNISTAATYQQELLVYAPFVIPSNPKVGIFVSGTRGRAGYATRIRSRVKDPYYYLQGGFCQFRYDQPAGSFSSWTNLPSPPTGLRVQTTTGTCPAGAPGPNVVTVYVQMANGQEQDVSNINTGGFSGIVGLAYEFEFDTTDPKPGAIP
jgi:P2-related tail formation protein